MTELLIYINRRSGVAHVDFWCPALADVPTECLRVEAYDPDRPRRKCSRCWNGWNPGRPRRSALAGTEAPVTERSEGNPLSGSTGASVPAIPATERATRNPNGLRQCVWNLVRQWCADMFQELWFRSTDPRKVGLG